MRKWLFGSFVTLALLLLLAVSASADSYVLDDIYASVEIPDSYIVLTPDNASSYAEWLIGRGTTSEIATNDMLSRGVLLQCWSKDDEDVCFELTATQSDYTQNVFDVNEQDTSMRATYRLSHYPNNDYADAGYDFSSSTWKKTDNGRFLILRYVFQENGQTAYRGLMRRTIRNGYEISFDMRVYNRSVTNKDNANLNTIWESFNFIEVLPLPPAASAKINVTSAPPEETNESDFDFAGTAAEGVTLTTVVMGLNYPTPMVSTEVVGSSGKFSMPIELPKEGSFMVTVTAVYQDEEVMSLYYPVTYQRTLLTVSITTDVPTSVTSDELEIKGTATPKSLLQVFVNEEVVYNKKVASTGKFTVTLDVGEEGTYDVVMVFSKPGLADRRFTYSIAREWSEADTLAYLKGEAIKPSYNTLINKIEGYDSRIMGYQCYLVDVVQSGDDWILKMALTKKTSGYSNIILVVTNNEPEYAVDTKLMMYGRCVGMSLPANEAGISDEDTASYPTFELLLLTTLE